MAMKKNTVCFAMLRAGDARFIETYIQKDVLASRTRTMYVEILAQPLEDIRILWPGRGKKNFILSQNETEKVIFGDAGFFQFKDGEYRSLSGEAFKRLRKSNILISLDSN